MQGSSTSQSPTNARAFASIGVAFRTEYGVGTLISVHFAAPYPARLYHCQRFAHNLTVTHAHDSWPVRLARPSPYDSFIHTSTPV